MTVTSAAHRAERPAVIVWAVALNIISGAGGLLFAVVWPDLDERETVIVVSLFFAVALVAAAWFLWGGNSRGAIGSVAVNILNILLAIPGFFVGEADIVIGTVVTIALSAATIGLVLSPGARAFWRGANGTRT